MLFPALFAWVPLANHVFGQVVIWKAKTNDRDDFWAKVGL